MIGGDSSNEDQYGIELILDMHGCDTSKFTRVSITEYFERLCELIDMQREDLHSVFCDRHSFIHSGNSYETTFDVSMTTGNLMVLFQSGPAHSVAG